MSRSKCKCEGEYVIAPGAQFVLSIGFVMFVYSVMKEISEENKKNKKDGE